MNELPSIVAELGLQSSKGHDLRGPVIRGTADVVAEACVPQTATLRTSVLATWADVVTGAAAGEAMNPRIPLTLDLEVQLSGEARVGDRLATEAVAIKAGRTVVVCESLFRSELSGEVIATAIASFIASPDPSHVFDGGFPDLSGMRGRLRVPLAERIGSSIAGPGVAEVPRRPDGMNATGAIQGGLVAFAAEEAALSLTSAPSVPYSLNVRYLRPFVIGPCRAEATGDACSSVVRLFDVGTGKLGAVATVRFGATENAARAQGAA